MGFGNYSFSTLQAIQGIAFRTLEKFTATQIVKTGLKVSRLLEDFKRTYPNKVPKKAGGGLLNFGSFVDVDDFELALHLVNTNNPAMAQIVKGAKGLPILSAYLSVLTNGAEPPPEHLLESALPFAIASLSLEGEIASVWSQNLQVEIARLAPLASKGLKFKGGKPKGSFGPLTKAIRKRLKADSNETPAAIWSALSSRPPTGLIFCDNRTGKYVEYDKRTHAGDLKTTGFRRFANIVTDEKKRLKILTV